MTTFTFVGCSFTTGEGLEFEKDDPGNYTNLVAAHFNTQSNNLALRGNTNYNIFITALNQLLYSTADKLFVQWTSLNRLWLYPGPDTTISLSHTIVDDYKYRDLFFSKKDLQKVTDIYHLLNHDYHNLLELINYSKILESVAKEKTQLVFINGLVPWTKEINDMSTVTDYSTKLSKYSKEILEFDGRDDQELDKFFIELNYKINRLQHNQWVNIFESLSELQVDVGNDNQHPGPSSHKLYATNIINYLNNHNDKRL
jgi:hypothetical protein